MLSRTLYSFANLSVLSVMSSLFLNDLEVSEISANIYTDTDIYL